jgi:hypothetical protein
VIDHTIRKTNISYNHHYIPIMKKHLKNLLSVIIFRKEFNMSILVAAHSELDAKRYQAIFNADAALSAMVPNIEVHGSETKALKLIREELADPNLTVAMFSMLLNRMIMIVDRIMSTNGQLIVILSEALGGNGTKH